MRKLTPSLLILFSLLTMHCVKKQFIAFETPHSVMHIKPGASIEILQEPLKKEMIVWDASKLAEISVEGLLRVTYKETDYFYLQMNCPQQLKCNGKKVYIPRNLTHAPDAGKMPFKSEYKEPPADASSARFVIAESAKMKDLMTVRDWYSAAAKKDLPAVFDRVIFGASLPAQNQIEVYGNLVYLARSVRDNEYPEKPAPEFVRSFPIYEEILKRKGANLNDGQKKFLRELHSGIEAEYTKLLRKEIDEFPFENASYSAMAAAFNKICAPQMLKAELVNRIAKNAPFIIKAPAAATPVIVPGGAALYAQETPTAAAEPAPVKIQTSTSLAAGVVFEYDLNGKKNKTPVAETELVAFSHEKGLGFQLGKDKAQATIIEPVEESLYLKSGNKAEIQKFMKAIPDYKKVITDYDLDLALLRLAMKYGKGELNRQSGLFEYEIDLSKGSNFWVVLAALKQRFDVTEEDTYSGEIPPRLNPQGGYAPDKGKIVWYQKYDKASKQASMGIKGQARYCERSCWDVSVDTVCMTNEDTLKIQFRPSALFEQNIAKDEEWRPLRNLHADFLIEKDSPENSCNNYLKLGRLGEKFE